MTHRGFHTRKGALVKQPVPVGIRGPCRRRGGGFTRQPEMRLEAFSPAAVLSVPGVAAAAGPVNT